MARVRSYSLTEFYSMIRTIFTYLLMLLSVLAFFSCGDIELEDTDKEQQEDKKDGGTTDPDEEEGAISVAGLSNATLGSYVMLKCYIVGTASKSLKNTQFGASGSKTVASNIVVADSPDETDYTQCAACELKSKTAARENLNLVDNPENVGQLVYLFGTVEKYFGKIGLKAVEDYQWGDDWGGDDDDGGDDNPPPADDTSVASISISDAAAEVFEGC